MRNYSCRTHNNAISLRKKITQKRDARSQSEQEHLYLSHKRVLQFLPSMTTGYEFTDAWHLDLAEKAPCLAVHLIDKDLNPAYCPLSNKRQAALIFSDYKDSNGYKYPTAKRPEKGSNINECFSLLGIEPHELALYRGCLIVSGGLVDPLVLHEASNCPVLFGVTEGSCASLAKNIAPVVAPHADILATADNDNAGLGFLFKSESAFVIPCEYGCDWWDVLDRFNLDEVERQFKANRYEQPKQRIQFTERTDTNPNKKRYYDNSEDEACIAEYRKSLWHRFNLYPLFMDERQLKWLVNPTVHPNDHATCLWMVDKEIERVHKTFIKNVRLSPTYFPMIQKEVRQYYQPTKVNVSPDVDAVELEAGAVFNFAEHTYQDLDDLEKRHNYNIIGDCSLLGYGKTKTSIIPNIMRVVKDGNKAVLVVPTKALVKSAYQALSSEEFGVVAHYKQKPKAVTAADVLVTTASSLCSSDLYKCFLSNCTHVFIDEFRECFSLMVDDECGQKGKSYQAFEALITRSIRNNGLVFFADAFLVDMNIHYFTDLMKSSDIPLQPMLIGKRESPNYIPPKVWFYLNKSGKKTLINKAALYVSKGKNICVTCETKGDAKVIYETLKEAFPDESGVLLTADTEKTKQHKSFFEDPSTEALKYRFIVHSPVMSSGVSIEPLDYAHPHIFASFLVSKGQFKTYTEIAQMIARVRGVREIHIVTVRNKKPSNAYDVIEEQQNLEAAASFNTESKSASRLDLISFNINEYRYSELEDIGIGLALLCQYLGYEIASPHEYSNEEFDCLVIQESPTAVKEELVRLMINFQTVGVSEKFYKELKDKPIKTLSDVALIELFHLKSFFSGIACHNFNELIEEHVRRNIIGQVVRTAATQGLIKNNDDNPHLIFQHFSKQKRDILDLVQSESGLMVDREYIFDEDTLNIMHNKQISKSKIIHAYSIITKPKIRKALVGMKVLPKEFGKTKLPIRSEPQKIKVVKLFLESYGIYIIGKQITIQGEQPYIHVFDTKRIKRNSQLAQAKFVKSI